MSSLDERIAQAESALEIARARRIEIDSSYGREEEKAWRRQEALLRQKERRG